MIKPNRPSEKIGANADLNADSKVSSTKPGEMPQIRFHSADDFSNWIESQLDHLEALFDEFSSKDSLRGYFSR